MKTRSQLTRRRIVTAVSACLLSLPAAAQLDWLNAAQEFSPRVMEEKVYADFAFTNLGEYAVTIQNVKTSCGCTTAKLSKKLYEPGEGGVIQTTFTIGDRTGTQNKRITVTTDDPKKSNRSLQLKIRIPNVVTVSPRVVTWRVGDRVSERLVRVLAMDGVALEVLEVTSSSPTVTARLDTAAEGRKYTVTLTPASLKEPFNGVVRLRTKINSAKEKTFTILCRALPPRTFPAPVGGPGPAPVREKTP